MNGAEHVKQAVPIRCEGVAVVLLKKSLDQYHVLMLKRAGRMLHNEWCYVGGGIERGREGMGSCTQRSYEETGIRKSGCILPTNLNNIIHPWGSISIPLLYS